MHATRLFSPHSAAPVQSARRTVQLSATDVRTPYAANLLIAGHTVRTDRGFAGHSLSPVVQDRPYYASPHIGHTTWHASASSALSCLATF